jgi:hypothetical protein
MPISRTLKRAPIAATIHMSRGGDFEILNASHNGTAYNSQIPNPKGIQISISKIPTVSRMMKIDQSFLRKMDWLMALSSGEPDQTERNLETYSDERRSPEEKSCTEPRND